MTKPPGLCSSVLKKAWSTHVGLVPGIATRSLRKAPSGWTHVSVKIFSAIALQTSKLESVTTTTATDRRYGGKQVIRVDQPLYDYMLAHTREPKVLCELREETSSMTGSQMQASPDQGQFLAMLVRLMGAERCIEVGVYTGYSSLAVAMALPEHGHLVACERDKISLSVAQKYYERAGVSHKVNVHHGMALDTLKQLLHNGEENSYDFAFLDADKRSYCDYYELLLQLIRSGGLVVIDNVLWHGKVADPKENDKKTQSLRSFNTFLQHDTRVDVSMVPIGDGMTLCRKREIQD